MTNSIGQLIFFLLTPVSHIGASLFFAKPRFDKVVTVGIWLEFAVLMLILPSNLPTLTYFLTLALHMILFIITTKGALLEKGFLLLTYAISYTCVSSLFIIISSRTQSDLIESIAAICLMVVMQVLLYAVLLPSFRKVMPYVHTGWGTFYSVVLGFFALVAAQAAFPVMEPMTNQEIIVFLLTILAFCITYTSVFASMKNMVELTREKQKQTHAELLLAQVQSQAKEAELVRQNRHDMRHHYQMMLSYAENGELAKLTDYLMRQTQRIEAITTGRFCENETVNNILKVYHQKAADQNIAMKICAAAKPTLSASAPDLVAIIANILENALHGAAASGCKEPVIRVNIKHQAGRFVVSCDNPCVSTLDFEEMPEHLRGIGIHSITATADQYGGTCRFSAKEGVFRCMVVMDE